MFFALCPLPYIFIYPLCSMSMSFPYALCLYVQRLRDAAARGDVGAVRTLLSGPTDFIDGWDEVSVCLRVCLGVCVCVGVCAFVLVGVRN
jgi:hypothetical protein